MTTLKKGSTGDLVRQLELLLKNEGYDVKVDAIFDSETESAVKNYQHRMGLVVDGIAGDKTISTLARGKDPRHLSMVDIKTAAKTLGVPVASIMAVNEVESLGNGFLTGDTRPVILFERHVMYQRLKAHKLDAEAFAIKYPNIVNPIRGGYKGNSAEYMRLSAAKTIDPVCALESCSWGAFQIMGYHWKNLNYASVGVFVDMMTASEANQLDAFVRFIKADSNLLKALKAKKWADFARLYNGAAYKENLYDIKLTRSYDSYAAELSETVSEVAG